MFHGLTPDAGGQLWQRLLEIIWRVEELPCPPFASHALCLTAAFELSLACDLLLSSIGQGPPGRGGCRAYPVDGRSPAPHGACRGRAGLATPLPR